MPINKTLTLSIFCLTSSFAAAQAPKKPAAQPDVLILKDGEKIIGHLETSTGAAVKFKSDALGELTVDWSKVEELHSSERFAAIPKGIRLKNAADETKVPVGTVAVTAQKIELSPQAPPAQPQAVSVDSISNLVAEDAFRKALRRTNFLQGWAGAATGGISLTDATQKSQTYTAAVNLVRAVPTEDWLDPRSRTIFNLNEAYGKLTEPGTPSVKTSLFHADAEQDLYFSPRLFAFVSAAFDHSFSQGLQLQQNYGAGIGWVLIKDAKQELDFKASVNYIDERFADSTLNQNLVGSSFAETYSRKLPRSIIFVENLTITPAWNQFSAYSAVGGASLTFPVFHRFGLSLATLDDFLNNPPPGFKKNSYQLTVGANYSFK